MKGTIFNILFSSVFASVIGCLVILIGLLINMLPKHMTNFISIFGGSFTYYLVAVVAMFLILIIFSPIYIGIRKLGYINYISVFLIGAFVVLVSYRFTIPIRELFFVLAGGVNFVLFHYRFSQLDNI